MSIARLLRDRGKRDEARDLLANRGVAPARLVARAEELISVAVMGGDAVTVGPFCDCTGNLARLVNIARGTKRLKPRARHCLRRIGEAFRRQRSGDGGAFH
jgi:hypothetical protein